MPDTVTAVLPFCTRVVGLEEAEQRIDAIVQLVGHFGHSTKKSQIRLALAPHRQSTLVGCFTGTGSSVDKLVGIAHGIPREHFLGKDYYIGTVVVDPEFRHCGVGTAMMRTLIDIARAMKCGKVELTSSKPGAQALYRRLGFNADASHLFRLVL